MSTPGESPRRADAVRNRQLALEAATELLAKGVPLTVETIAKKAGLGVGTVVRAFGGKDGLLDAAVAGLLEPVVRRSSELLEQAQADRALRSFLDELMVFQSAYHGISEHMDGRHHLPATSALRAQLTANARQMIIRAQADGAIRTDIDPEIATTVISQTAYAIARLRSAELRTAYLTVLMDGLRRHSPHRRK